ncbi:DUF4232 domain-containing protein [Kitasatospora sp. NPDC018058]|uniref:DUF4232 domain-containing protein n=1 Tax=Kitasatospora sp. NPDC018058 TaxID=3364025 RepID=UPI0037BFE4C9
MSVRTSRTRLITAAASVALAAFSITACSDNGDIATATGPSLRAAVPTTPAPTSANTTATTATTGGRATASTGKDPATAPQSTGPKPVTGTPAPKAPAAPSAAKPTTCEGSNTKTTAAPLNRPVNHMLLTVTNTGSGTCYLYGYPAVRFGEAQSVPPVITDSKPQAVVTLQPGESGYASVNLSSTDGGNGSHGDTAMSLAVYFHGPSGNESVGAAANPPLPAKGVYVDDSLKVT